ncbi:MAG: hypothetical protein EA352_10435 [Gemmatimonadales bacterium]|nr:MAG: hypothetical protein EA352_10435 [Gemmatimonadales bacterium]
MAPAPGGCRGELPAVLHGPATGGGAQSGPVAGAACRPPQGDPSEARLALTFLAPLLLALLAALAVPLVLHLRRQRQVPSSFPALRYLEDTLQRTSRHLRLRNRLLLLVRLALLAVLALAAARLVLPVGGGTHPPAAVVLVVDDGIRSATVLEDRIVLDHLREKAGELLAALGPADRVWILHGTGEGQVVGPDSPAGARRALAGLEPGSAPPHLPGLLARGRAILEARSEARTHLVLASADPVAGEDGARPDAVVGRDLALPPNTGIAGVEVVRGGARDPNDELELLVSLVGDEPAGREVRFQAAPDGAGGTLDPELRVQALSNGGGRALLRLPPPGEEGWVLGHVEIEADALRADDRAPVAVEVGGQVSLRLITDPDEPSTSWLREAARVLEASGGVEDVSDAPASPGETWILNGLPGIEALEDPEALPPSTTLLLVPPGEVTSLPRLDRALAEFGAGWSIRAGDGGRPGPLLAEGGIFAPGVRDALAGSTVAGSRHLEPRAGVEGSPGQVRLRTADGRPWLVEASVGDRTLLIMGSDGVAEGSNLGRSAAGILLLDTLLEQGTGTPAPGAGIDTSVLPPPVTSPGARPEPEPPAGPGASGLLGDRRGGEVSAWLLALALVLLLLDGWLGRKTPARPDTGTDPAPPNPHPN